MGNGELLVSIATAISLLVGAVVLIAKSRMEIEEMKQELSVVNHQLKPNGGKSVRDSIDRTETLTAKQNNTLDLIVSTMGEIKTDIAGIRREQSRLAQVDVNDRETANEVHKQMWNAINRLEK